MESLARQAMPHKAEEITRLFREGKPDIALLDGLEKTQRWPLLNDVFRTETAADVVALSLCDTAKAKEVDNKPGCIEELLRLYESAVGFKPASESRKWKTLRPKAAECVLFSEFLFDLPEGAPDALSAVPRAGGDAKTVVYAACDRMRSDMGLREVYMELTQKIEADLCLAEVMGPDFDPGERDTFPVEERRLLVRAVELAVAGDMPGALTLVEGRKRSIWRFDSRRSPAWTALERGITLLESATRISKDLKKNEALAAMVKAYAEGGADLDRAGRLFETALTACTEDETIEPLTTLCRRRRRETALNIQNRFLEAVRAEGWPPEGVPRDEASGGDLRRPVLRDDP